MSLYGALRPLLFGLPAETAHDLGTLALRTEQRAGPLRSLVRDRYCYRHPALAVERFGLTFPTPVGMAAGFDKNGEVTDALADLGFGFVEAGTVTPYPQPGNPRPRMFRLREDEGLVNRLGFNSQGADRVAERLRRRGTPDVPLGVNVGKMNTSDEAEGIEDYRRALVRLYEFADYVTVNVSCPNTPEEYDQQSPAYLRELFSTLADHDPEDKPFLVKVGPDATREGLADLVDIVEEFDLDGIVATNTTTDHEGLRSPNREEWGGVSGRPLRESATETIRTLAGLTDLPIVGVGGVADAGDAYEKIRAGACLVQLYTGFVYRGPSTARDVAAGLVDLLAEDGFASVDEAVGVDA